MIASNRHRRAQLRTLRATQRRKARGVRTVNGAVVAPASAHLAAAGIPADVIDRYKSAFSRGLTPATVRNTVIKLAGRATKTVPVKLYDAARIRERLATYRPRKDVAAAAAFAAAAARTAA